MGFFSDVISGVLSSVSGSSDKTETQSEYECEFCFTPIEDPNENGGFCNDCDNGEGTDYCCGQMYEDGETHCRSCGDEL